MKTLNEKKLCWPISGHIPPHWRSVRSNRLHSLQTSFTMSFSVRIDSGVIVVVDSLSILFLVYVPLKEGISFFYSTTNLNQVDKFRWITTGIISKKKKKKNIEKNYLQFY